MKLARILLCGLLMYSASMNVLAQSLKVDFSNYYDLIYQIRVISSDAGSKSSIGSGFQINQAGLIVTNFHVVSAYVNSPDTNEIHYVTQNGEKGVLQLLDFDVISDLAVLKHPAPAADYFALETALPSKGDYSYALGNPADYGMVLVPGPTNGLVEHSYEQRVLFSGSLNPGMSGGPALNKEGAVIGVNVATAGSQLSFLVPAKKVTALIAQDRELSAAEYQVEIANQIKQWQRQRVQTLLDSEWAVEQFASRALFGEIRHDFQCWGGTNESDKERAVAAIDKSCRAGDDLYLGYDIDAGQISFSFEKTTPLKLNNLQFMRSISTYMRADNRSGYEHSTNYECHTDFVDNEAKKGVYNRVTICVRAYKKLAGLYDSLLLLEQIRNKESFVAHLSLSAIEQDQLQAMHYKFLEASL